MEIDKEQYKQWITDVFAQLRKADTELFVSRYVVFLLRETGMIPSGLWEQMIAAAKENPALENIMSQKYDSLLSDLLQAIEVADLQSKVLELLRQWQPSTPPN